jgi:hypothetical protein
MLIYGYEPKLPLSQGLPAADAMPLTRAMTADEEVMRVPAANRLHGAFAATHADARERLHVAQQRQKQYADQRCREVEFSKYC